MPLTLTNLLLEVGKVRRLHKVLRSRSNSEGVRRVIDERLAVETGLEALRSLRKLGGAGGRLWTRSQQIRDDFTADWSRRTDDMTGIAFNGHSRNVGTIGVRI